MSDKKTQSGLLKAASTLQPGDSSEAIYDEWSGSYDADLQDEWGYIAPRLAVDALDNLVDRATVEIADLGCGTGLVGAELQSRGYQTVDGFDISDGMLEQARAKEIYRTLSRADLTARIPAEDGTYDAALCIGAMGAGHLDARHVPELIRVVKPGGWLVIYMNGTFYEEERFEERFRGHESHGVWSIEAITGSNYMETLDRPGKLITARKPEDSAGE